MKTDFLVFGADGIQGKIVTRFLLEKGYSLTVSDLYDSGLKSIIKPFGRKRVKFFKNNLKDLNATIALMKKFSASVVVNCADMYCNLNVYKACIATKKHCVDLGSWVELTREQLKMDKSFKRVSRTAITGCGSVPGIGNVMLAHASEQFDRIDSVDVGFAWNSNKTNFVVPFSMKSILEELTYSPLMVRAGKWIKKAPLQVSLRRNFRLVGPQRCFMVQHPELYTFRHYFRRRGLKNIRFFAGFPEHSLEKIKMLIELGFHSDKPVRIEEADAKVAPFDLLNPVLKYLSAPKGYTESENLFVDVYGLEGKKKKKILMEGLVPPVKGWEKSGCNIDTGFPVVIIAEMIADGRIKKRGSFAPEAAVPAVEFFKELDYNGIKILQNGISLL